MHERGVNLKCVGWDGGGGWRGKEGGDVGMLV